MSCHAERGCILAATNRSQPTNADDCAGCHMPRSSSVDIPHSASSNHRIPRRAGTKKLLTGTPANTSRDRRDLVIFHRERMDRRELGEAERDRGVALCRDGAGGARIALSLSSAAVVARPDDVIAWESKGHALGGLGRHDEALAAIKMALTIEPNRESALVEAARLAAKLDRRSDAVGFLNRAINVNPWRSDYRADLAFVYFYERNWQASADACRDALPSAHRGSMSENCSFSAI